MDIVTLAVKVASGEIDKARTGVAQLGGELEKVETRSYKVGYAIGGSMKIAAGAAVGLAGAIGGITLAFANHIDNLQDAADMYGYSATQISAMKTAAESAGGTLQDVAAANGKVRKEIAEGGEAFKTLGVNMRDSNGQMKSAQTLAAEVATKYREGGVSASQFSAAQKVLGEDVSKFAAIVASQADAIELVNELQKAGIGIVEGSITATDDYSAAKNRANLVMESAGSIITAKVLPAFTFLIKTMTDSYVEGGLVRQMFDGLIGMMPGLVGFGGTVAKVIATAAQTVQAFAMTLGAAGAALAALLSGNFEGVAAIAKAWKGDIDGIAASNKRVLAGIDATTSGMKAALASAKNLKIATQGDGRNGDGGPGLGAAGKKAIDEAAKAKKKADEEAAKNLENYAALLQDQNMALLKAQGIDTERLALHNKTLEIVSKIKGLNQDGINQMVQQVMQGYDMAKHTGDRKKLEEDITKEKQKQTDAVRELIVESNKYIAKERAEFNNRFLSKQQREGLAREEQATGGYDAEIRRAEGEMSREGVKPEQVAGLERHIANMRQARSDALASIQTLNAEKAAAEETIEEGVGRGVASYLDSIPSRAQLIADGVRGVAQTMEDAFVQMASTGKANFKDLARVVIQQLAAMYAKMVATKLVGMFLGGLGGAGSTVGAGVSSGAINGIGAMSANGNVFDGNGLVHGYGRGELGVLGEKGAEAVMPLKRGANGQLGVQMVGGSSSSGPIQINLGGIVVQGGTTNEQTGASLMNTVRKEFIPLIKQTMTGEKRHGGILQGVA